MKIRQERPAQPASIRLAISPWRDDVMVLTSQSSHALDRLPLDETFITVSDRVNPLDTRPNLTRPAQIDPPQQNRRPIQLP